MIGLGSIVSKLGRAGASGGMASHLGGWLGKNPMAVQMGLGAAGGYVFSGGSGWGALGGGIIGASAGTRGWKSGDKGLANLTKWSAGKLGIGRTITGSSVVRNTGMLQTGLMGSGSSVGRSTRMMMSDISSPGAAVALRGNPSYAALSKTMVGANVAAKGAALGLGIGLARGAISFVGNTFGGSNKAPHGATFSGMGNGVAGMM